MVLTPEIIKQKLTKPLPGVASHLKMAPIDRVDEIRQLTDYRDSARKSGVMILLFPENNTLKVILIRRSTYVGIHAGQIAFPGGRYEESDITTEKTAYREIEEEIGIPPEKIEIVGQLTDMYAQASNFLISVFVGYISERPELRPQEREVDDIFTIDIDAFLNPDVIQTKEFKVQTTDIPVKAPYYKVEGIEIWGASAMVIAELLDMITD
jgi:8-oxo-dGTP pyrophosphatase MutT (NUDIX family)